MKGFFQKFKEGLQKTTPNFAQALGKVRGFWGDHKISEEDIGTLEKALYTADFGETTTTEILNEIKTAYRKDPELRGKQAALIGVSALQAILEGSEAVLEISHEMSPQVICMLGVNGAGKTTT